MASRIGLFLLYFSLITAAFSCPVWMLNSIGSVNPSGDVIEPIGETIKIDCTLNSSIASADSRNLIWKVNGKVIPSEYIRIVDNYTAQLTISNVTVTHSGNYICLNNETKPKMVCNNNVFIGYPPLEVKDFSCISHNWEYLLCSFTLPFNPVPTKYLLKIINKNIPDYECPLIRRETLRKETQWICNYTMHHEAKAENVSMKMYSESSRTFYFKLEGSNKLGKWNQTFTVDHFSHVRPNKPEQFTTLSVTQRTLIVNWTRPNKLKSFGPGLIYQLYYKSQWDPTWQKVNLEVPENTNYSFQGLRPYTNYSFKVQSLSAVADASNAKLWSENATTTVITDSDVPGHPPLIISGSYQEKASLNSRTIILFWQMLPPIEKNGPDFLYSIDFKATDSDDDIYDQTLSTEKIFAKFYNLELDKSYDFTLYSKNKEGRSKEGSVLRVEKKSKIPPQPEAFTAIYFDHGIYELSWQAPSNSNNIVNYTLFFCSSVKPHPFECEGNLSWIYVDKTARVHNITVANYTKINYQFGISSNTKQASSGLVWATCIIPYNGTLNRIKKVSLTSISKDSIRVAWKLDCSERIGIVTGFNIYYCQIPENKTSAPCIDNESGQSEKVHVPGPNNDQVTLIGLKPYSFYKVTVSAETRAGEGEVSHPFVDCTQESAPSVAAQNIKVSQGENNSVILEWDATTPITGIITRYTIYVNGEKPIDFIVTDKKQTHFKKQIFYEYGDTEYSFELVACIWNNECSHNRSATYFQTQIGAPGIMSRPQITPVNLSHIMLTFEEPVNLNGPVDFYNLKIVRFTNSGKNITTEVEHITKNSSFHYETHCQDTGMENSNVSFAVQAVNILNNTILRGPFSEPAVHVCQIEPIFQTMIIAVGSTIGIIILIMLSIYGYRRFRRKCWEIKNIKIHLPKGLEPESLKSPDFNSIQPQAKRVKAKIDARELLNQLNSKSQGSPRSRNTSGETRISSSSMDELLQNNGNGRTETNVDNSSALGSVSSTQTTRSNLSSESGNDLESLPPTTPDMVFTDNPMNKRQSLPETELNKTQQLLSDSKLPSDEIPDNYSKFGCYFNDKNPTLTNGYLPTNPSIPKCDNSAYVLPSSPENSVSPALPYSQIGLAAGTNYMNYPHTNLLSTTSPIDPSINAILPPSYSVLGIADNFQSNVNTTPDNIDTPGLGYCAVGLASSPAPKNSVHPGYVAASIAEMPINGIPIQNNYITEHSPSEPDSLEKSEAKPSSSQKPYVPATSNAPTAMYSRVSLQQPVMSNGYVPQSKIESDSIQIGKSSPEEKKESSIKDDLSSIQTDSLETPSISTTGSTNSKPSTPKKNGYVSLNMMDDPSMSNPQSSNFPEIMKTSQTSDEFDSPGPYSRVVSMNYDDASSNNVSDKKS